MRNKNVMLNSAFCVEKTNTNEDGRLKNET